MLEGGGWWASFRAKFAVLEAILALIFLERFFMALVRSLARTVRGSESSGLGLRMEIVQLEVIFLELA